MTEFSHALNDGQKGFMIAVFMTTGENTE